jgi:methionine biosynthesis protein MetW
MQSLFESCARALRNGRAIQAPPQKLDVTDLLVEKWITPNDLVRSATASMITDLLRALEPLRGQRLRRMLDIGCGFGGLTRLLGEHLEIQELHGIDKDSSGLDEARKKGVEPHQIDVNGDHLPFADGYFDLIVSLGMIDHFLCFDEILREVCRIVRPGGYALISLPNLASWNNRLCLLLGYQPRDIEISQEILAGVHPWYYPEYNRPARRLRCATAHAFQELMAHHGFQSVGLTGARPPSRKMPPGFVFADLLLTRKATLARRFFYLGSKRDGHVR